VNKSKKAICHTKFIWAPPLVGNIIVLGHKNKQEDITQ